MRFVRATLDRHSELDAGIFLLGARRAPRRDGGRHAVGFTWNGHRDLALHRSRSAAKPDWHHENKSNEQERCEAMHPSGRPVQCNALPAPPRRLREAALGAAFEGKLRLA